MNLKNLFKKQAELDARIYAEHPVQDGEDRLAKKILALQVELGELANEWRGFKFWSSRQEPVTKDLRVVDYKESGEAILETYNPLLEEYVDCLHFILNIGLDLKTTDVVIDCDYTGINATETFIIAFETTVELANAIREGNKSYIYQVYEELFNLFVGLGEKYLGFDWNQIKQAYFDKNNINHQRQESGY